MKRFNIKNYVTSFLFAFLLLSPNFVNAKINDLYAVDNVYVDVTSVTSADARKKATYDGYKKALDVVLNRLALKQDLEKYPISFEGDYANLVSEFSVLSEKSSDVRYIATLKIVLKPEMVKKLLSDNFVPFTEEIKKKTLLIPLFYTSPNSDAIIWGEDNLLLKSFSDNNINSKLTPIIVPIGDVRDVSVLSPAGAKSPDSNALKTIARKYNVDNVIVVSSILYQGKNPKVDVYIQKGIGDEVNSTIRVEYNDDLDVGTFYRQVANRIVEKLEDSWKLKNVVHYSEDTEIIALVDIKSLKDWVNKERNIKAIPIVKECYLQAMKKDIAQVSISFSGGLVKLKELLSKKGLELNNINNIWIIE